MLFNSFSFLFAFLPLVLAGSWLIRTPSQRVLFWTVASYAFYAAADPRFVILLFACTLVPFVLAREIHARRDPRIRRALLTISVTISLGLLAAFKYTGLVVDTIMLGVGWLAGPLAAPAAPASVVLDIVLPVGISFFTFEALSYTIDVYRGHLEPERSFVRFACFMSLFPHLIAGPILRPGDILPQLRSLRPRHQWDLPEGLFLFSVGLVKKVLIADRIGAQVDPLFADVGSVSTPTAWLAMVGYALQIYFDFSGYTDMARGLARLLGLHFTINFDSPYRALDPSDFWRRWHISLSTWLRDYLYIPLGGNRGGRARTYRNLLLTMLLGGLWHGAGWNFVLWGGLHGGALSLYHRFGRTWDAVPAGLRRAATFVFVVLTWVPFRLSAPADILSWYRTMFGADVSGPFPDRLLAVTAVAAAIAFLPPSWNSNHIRWGLLRPAPAVALGVLVFLALMYVNTSTTFLYFQF
ncbi:MAG: MBOAT family O-acyltransferase [Candidatus Rokuibacteriota bacterium]